MKRLRKRCYLLSLGCAKNRVDSELVKQAFEARGYTFVDAPERAALILINTCGFIRPAVEESVDAILEAGELRRRGDCEALIVIGCLVQRYGARLAESLPEVDLLVGCSELGRLLERGKQFDIGASPPAAGEAKKRVWCSKAPSYLPPGAWVRESSLGPHAAYVKIAEGCNRGCAFCTVPQIRGAQRSRAPGDVIAEVAAFLERGAVEINLVAQDLSAYGRDLEMVCKLSTLLEALAEKIARADFWLRCLYLYPSALTSGLIRTLRRLPFVVPYLDVPLQHAADGVLRAMQRGYGRRTANRLMERIRRDWPQAAVRTTLLVGHPAETTAAFKTLCRFVERWQMDQLGVFAFSPEAGTVAGEQEIGPRPAPATAQKRRAEIMALQREISRSKLARLRGRVFEVLVEGVGLEYPHIYEGRHAGQAPEVDGKVYITADQRQADGAPRLQCGQRVAVEITDSGDYDLVGTVLAQVDEAATGEVD